MLTSRLRSRKIVIPRNLNDSTVGTADPLMSRGGREGEVHNHLNSLKSIQLKVVFAAPGHQLLHLLSVCRIIAIRNETDQCCVVCKLEELNRGVPGTVVGVDQRLYQGLSLHCRESRAGERARSPVVLHF